MTHPACMTEAEYADWLASVRLSRCTESPCECCTGKYQQAMTAAGRCDEALMLAEFAYFPSSRYVKREVKQPLAHVQ